MIKVEVGKTYEVRNINSAPSSEEKITIIKKIEKDIYGFEYLGSDRFSYREDGSFMENGEISDFDLVKEIEL